LTTNRTSVYQYDDLRELIHRTRFVVTFLCLKICSSTEVKVKLYLCFNPLLA
jgi:hypothetical protein